MLSFDSSVYIPFSQERERQFEIDIRRAKGLEVKRMLEDGNCLFRAVADQVYGDSEAYDLVRQMCIDYMVWIFVLTFLRYTLLMLSCQLSFDAFGEATWSMLERISSQFATRIVVYWSEVHIKILPYELPRKQVIHNYSNNLFSLLNLFSSVEIWKFHVMKHELFWNFAQVSNVNMLFNPTCHYLKQKQKWEIRCAKPSLKRKSNWQSWANDCCV